MAAMHFRFLDLPLTIRQQIYSELLVPLLPEQFLHIQINAESSDIFYAKNLFTVISFNNQHQPENILAHAIRRMALCTVDDPNKLASCSRFAMTMDILVIGRRISKDEQPSWVVPARALPYVTKCLEASPRFAGEAFVAQFRIHNTFRYEIDRFSELTFGRLLTALRVPYFTALSVKGPVHPDYHQRLVTKLTRVDESVWFDFGGAFATHKSWIWGHLTRLRDMNWDLSMKQGFGESRLLLRGLDIVWDFHSYLNFRHNNFYAQASLFQSVADVYYLLSFAHLVHAKKHPQHATSIYLDARQAAEEGITYLNREDRFVDKHTFETFPEDIRRENVHMVDRAKAMLCRKASKACVKLGDSF
ncbi:hypothetical protein N0V90_001240 [Kalmusia sp. IMI 367209]|nr:hypothetical protein N0V90_001240 [Kalmusia sp. IMI 367209]